MSFEEVASELFRLPPAEFTSRRNAVAKEIRADDRELADRIAKLPKPALAAWALDVFAHERDEELSELLDLAAELREAQRELSRERMQGLTAQAHSLVEQVVRDVARVAHEGGNALSDPARTQVEQTLRAAMADPDAADAVRAGLLSKPLEPGGFGSVDLTGAVAGAPKHVPPRRRPSREAQAPHDGPDEKAQRALEEAEDKQQRAESALSEADGALAAAEAEHEGAGRGVTRLRAELHEAEQRQAAADRELRKAEQARERAAKHAAAARRRTEVARKAVER